MDKFHQSLKEISVDRIRNHINSIEGIRHPRAAPAALERAGEYISNALQSPGYSMGEHWFDDGGGRFRNIIATRKGTLHPEKRVIVLAYYDTVPDSPGADDNASGIAVMLEVATVLSHFSHEKTIQFIGVNLEENSGAVGSGLRGSRALAEYAREEVWDIEGVVVLESVAYAGASVMQTAPPGIPIAIPENGDFIAVVGNARSKDLVQDFGAAIGRYRIPLSYFPLVVPGNGEMLPDTRRSDHAPFWDNGYTAIMVTDTTNFRNPHYHQPSDTLETLNLPFAAEVCRATAGLVIALAGAI